MNFKAVIFDMDGVIFDSERIGLQEWIKLGEKYSIPDIAQVYPKCIGVNAVYSKRIFTEHYGENFPYDSYRQEIFKEIDKNYGNGKMPLKSGIGELLLFLKEMEWHVGLASSTQQEVVKRLLYNAELLPYFETLTCGDMVKKSKPEPDIFLKAAETLGVKPEECIVIEDSYNGIRAASKAGMFSIMIPDMFAPDEEMKQLASAIFNNLHEVREFLRIQ